MKLAAIDIGSNAARLAIHRVWMDDDILKTHLVEFVRFPLRLGDSVFINGSISPQKIENLLDLAKCYAILLRLHKVSAYKAYATSALRDASNGIQITQLIQQECNIDVQIISGSEEASLIFEAHNYILEELEHFLFIDVGGGSTELTAQLPNGERISKSFDIGTIRILDGLDSEEIWDQMRRWIRKNVQANRSTIAIATGGNINKAFSISGNKKDKYISTSQLDEIYQRLNKFTLKERINFLGLNPDRADVIIPALDIYTKVLKWAKISRVYVSGLSLRDGMLRKLIEEQKIE